MTNRLGGQQGCLGENCREGCAETAYVELPPTVLLNTNLFDSPLDTCSTRTITVTVRNAGMLSVYTTTVQETLPLGLNYVAGTTEVSTDTVHWQPGPEPVIAGGQLTWSPANGAPLDVWLARIRPYETVYIRFQAIASCPFTGGQIRVQTSYLDPCGAPHDTLPSSYVMQATQPDLVFYKTGQNLDRPHPDPFLVYGEPGETVVWTITATNLADAAPAPNVIISDTLPGNVVYQDATPGYSLSAPPVGTLGGTVTWTVGTLNPGQTVVLTVSTVISDPNGCDPYDTTNHAQLIWGCADGCRVILDDYADLRTRPVFEEIGLVTDLAPDTLGQCGGVLTITLFNDGPPAYNVILTDTLPAGFVYSETLSASTPPLVEPSDGDNPAVWLWDEVALLSGVTTLVFRVRNQNGSGDTCALPVGDNRIEVRYDDDRWDCLNTGPYVDAASQTLDIIGPALTIAKTPVDQTLDVGDPVYWTLTVQNTGTDVAYDVIVTDVVGTNYVNVAAGNGSDGAVPELVGNAITWTLLSPLAVGASWTATVTADLIATGDNTNRAWAQAACGTGCASSRAYAEAHTTLLQEFSKGPEIQTGTLGNLVTFHITATLSDEDALYTNVVLTDALPAGLGYVSAVLTYTTDVDGSSNGPVTNVAAPTLLDGSNIIWLLGNLPGVVQINGVITAMIQYTSANQDGVRWTNLIRMTYTDDGAPYVYTDTATVDIVLPSVDKTAASALRVGDVTTYNLIIHIPAGVSALGGNTFLRDALLPGIWYITDTEVLAWSPPAVGPITFTNRVSSIVEAPGYQVMYWYFGQPVTSELTTPTVITLSFQVQVVGLRIDNGEVVFTDTLIPYYPGNRVELWQEGYFIDDGYATSILIQPHLDIDKDSNPPSGSYVTSGDLITYTLTITNSGYGPAYDFIVSDMLPAGLTYVSSAISSTSPPTIAFTYAPPLNATGVLTWQVNELGGRYPYPYSYPSPWIPRTAVMTVVARVNDAITASLRLTNTAAIPYYDSQPGDGLGPYPPDEREYADGADSVVHYTARASIVKAVAPPTATIGSVITYTIRLPEPPITATLYTVTVTDQLSPWLALLTLAAPGNDTATWDTRAFTVTYATIPALAQRFITVTALVVSSAAAPPWEPVAGDVITNIVTLQHSNDVTTSNEVTVAVLEPRVVLDKRVETPRDPLGASDLITYSIVLTNTGDWPAYDLVITDSLPAGLVYVGAVDFTVTDPAALPGGAYPQWTLSQLNVGGVATIRFTARVSAAITAGVTLTNAAWGAYSNWPGDNPDERVYDIPTDTVPVDVGYPALDLEKSAWPSLVEVDGLLAYTLTVVNTGIVSATGVVVTDAVPLNTTYLACGPLPCNEAGGVVTWPLGVLDINATRVLTMLVQVGATLPGGTIITNTAWVTSTEGLTDTDQVTTPVNANAEIWVAKTGSPSPVTPGLPMTYSLTVTNDGPAAAENVLVTDTLPVEVSFVDATPYPNVSAVSPLVWNLGTLADGESRTILITVTVNADVTAGFTNTVIITTTTPGDNPANNEDDYPVAVLAVADLAITKSDNPDPVTPGAPLVYTLVYTNYGPSDAQNVVVTDTLPAEVLFVSATPSASSGPNPLLWNLGTLAAGASGQIVVTATVQPWVTQTFTNTVVIGTDTPETDYDNNRDDEPTDVTPIGEVGIVKTATPPTATIGSVITFTIRLPEPSITATLYNVTVTDQLWPWLALDTYDAPGGTFEWDWDRTFTVTYPIIPAGEQRVITVAAVVISSDWTPPWEPVAGDVITNIATLSYGAGVTTSNEVTITVVEPELVIIKASDPPQSSTVAPGQAVTYTVAVTNVGGSPAYSFAFWDELPVGMQAADPTLLNVTINGNAVDPADYFLWTMPGYLSLSFDEGVLPVGSVLEISYVGYVDPVVTPGLDLTNTASIEWWSWFVRAEAGRRYEPISDTNTVHVGYPALDLEKSAWPNPVEVGGLLTYTLTVSNPGVFPVTGVVVTDMIPVNTTFVAATPPHTGPAPDNNPGSVITWTLGDLAVGVTRVLTMVVQVDNLLPDGTLLNNTAWVTSTEGLTDTDTVTTVVESWHSLAITKTANPSPVLAGGLLTYTLAWAVAGNEPALGVTISDTVPAHTVYQSCVGAPCTESGGIVTWDLGDQNPPASGNVTLVVLVDSPLLSGTLLYNAALITDTQGLTDTDDITTVVASWHSLAITKTADPDPVTAGERLTYTLAWAVEGTEPALGVTISDVVPDNTTYVSSAPLAAVAPPVGGTGPVIWSLGDVVPPASGSVILVVQVNSALASGTVLTNAALISDTQGLTDTDQITTLVNADVEIWVLKTGSPSPVTPGEAMTYSLTVTNDGPSAAENVLVTDTLPAEVTFVAATPAQANGPNPLVWNLGTLVASESRTILITVTVNADVTAGFTNTVLITTTTPGDNPANNEDDYFVDVLPDVEIWVAKTGSPSPVTPGLPMTYSLTVTNDGPSAAENVVVTDTLPGEVTFVAATPAQTGGPNPLVWNLGTLAVGESRTILMTVTVNADVTAGFTNTVLITTTTPGDNPGNNEDDYFVD
ncbi:MAG TPA: hypothetical protein PKV20_18595, partial [Anaerolineae bacterium]|nr:hypothetical protein [Anaerolineae bacterium]